MPQWPHAPLHQLKDHGVYTVTAGTYLKSHFFQSDDSLTFLHDRLLDLSHAFGWELHAWAVFSNHYHFIARSPKDASNLRIWLAKLHQTSASMINKSDNTFERKVWYQFWDTRITYQTSYLARLNYVHQNPVKHGLVQIASQYKWCSAFQFETQANRAFVNSVYSFDYTKVKLYDQF